MEKLIEREDIIENKNGKVMLNQKIEKENGIITFYCKYGTITQVTLTFDTDYIQYKGNYGSVRLVRYDDVITLAGKYYGFQASDTQGRIINSMFPVLQDVFEILIKELSYTPLDLSKIREKRLKEIERDEWSKNFLHSKVPIVIFLVILGILYAINCQFAFVITLMVVIFYLTNMLNNKKKNIKK